MKTIHTISLAAAALAGLVAAVAVAQDTPPPMPDPADMPMGGPEAEGMPMGGPNADGMPMGGQMRGMMRGPGRWFDFTAIDTDKNGTVTRTELLARSTQRLTAADANGDGALDRAELIAAMPGPRTNVLMVFAPDPAADRADRLLAMMGATESGKIEIVALSERNANDLLARLDADHDGAISADEATDARPGRRHHHDGDMKPRG